jgi:hypothetical protein
MVLKLVVGVVGFVVILRTGVFILRTLGAPVPVAQEGQLRRVSLKYRCSVCGTEVRMTKASEEFPPPPRHCLEEMRFVAPIE